MKKEKIAMITVKLPASLHKKFKLEATKRGTEMSAIVRQFIQMYVQPNGGKRNGKRQ